MPVAPAVDTHVIVVGAGPVGLMLAVELRLGGADVIVLEQRDAPTTESRASTLHARTMELLDQRGLLAELGTPPHEPMGHFGGIPLDLSLPGPYPGQWKVPQVRTEELLGARALALGAELRRGHEVTGISQHPYHVEVEAVGPAGPIRVTARYAVGCDGEQSAVRRLGGFDFPGESAERELIRADIDGIEIRNRRFERLPGGLAIAARRGDGVTRVMVHQIGRPPRAGAADFDDITTAWHHVTGEDISHGTPLWVNAFGDASRQVVRYRDRRVLLAGDAAHQQMPIGGQALNLGLQDAANLGWKLAASATGRSPGGLLDSYHHERHGVGRRVLSNIRAQARLLLGGPETESLRAVMGELIAHENVRTHLAGMISGLDIRYAATAAGAGAGHPLADTAAGPEPGRHPLAGARLPHAHLLPKRPAHPTAAGEGPRPVSTLALLRAARGVLLVLTDDGALREELAEAAAPWERTLDTVTAAPPTDGPLSGVAALLVRPDGYVAWAGDSARGLAAELGRLFVTDAQSERARQDGAGRPARTAGSSTAPATARTAPHHSYDQHNGRRRNMGNLTGKTALVTGASRGMGRATAERLAREGALVAVHYATGADAAAEVVAGIEQEGGRAFAVQAELGVPGDVHELFLGLEQGLKERTGSTELNILVNNAGVMGGVKPEDTTPEQFDRLVAVNAKAPFFIIQRALTNIPDGGRIINISSGLTRFANPDEIAYAMTKGAVEMLALHYAKYLGPRNITINSVAPGITRNGNPLFDIPEAVEAMSGLSTFNRIGEPQDVADVIAFLASDDARWVTGSFVDASGGTLLG
ncbi:MULTISPECIES: SDR family oxidoreductase [unclassified Streptomyces]|uniref:SDR family oxidoreductase n=1 Tax=unclassified Streptomyces TaxID=2593676 RepID=UPI0023F2BAA4|nr:SDR family oxidoreductase [Streptomyces sp. A1136]